PMLESEHLTRSTEAGLDFIRDQQRSVFAAKFLGTNKEIRLWRLTAFALNGLDHKRRHIARAQLPVQLGDVIERNACIEALHELAKTVREAFAAHQRQRTQSQTVKCARQRHNAL